MSRNVHYLLAVGMLAACTGCSTLCSTLQFAPRSPSGVHGLDNKNQYTIDEYTTDRKEYQENAKPTTPPDVAALETARQLRDRIIDRIMADIEANYRN